MTSPTYDIAVIGGGIIGLSTALALTSGQSLSLVVLEAEKELASHQTGNNSGVIHSGLYYKPGSLKARYCVEGQKAMYRFCQEHGIAHEQCGKVVVATSEREIPALNTLEERGRANGLPDIKHLGPEEIKEYEPHVTGIAGLFVPESGIVDYKQVSETCAGLVEQAGGAIQKSSRVTGIERRRDEIILNTGQGEVHVRYLVNCGGLQSDRIARMCGLNPGLKIVPFRGEYYQLAPERHSLVRNLIYPVPDPAFPFLGVHFTRMIHGGIEAGPNAVPAFKRAGYTRTSFSLPDAWETLTYGGFLKLAARYWRVGAGEYYRSFSKRAFVSALQKLIPELGHDDVYPAGAGVRAQALAPDGVLIDDFHIVKAERMVHVLNAPSPAATASLIIGRYIADVARRDFDLAA